MLVSETFWDEDYTTGENRWKMVSEMFLEEDYMIDENFHNDVEWNILEWRLRDRWKHPYMLNETF